jgi:hypothetical protein
VTPRELEEYRALRETIRERGTARVWIVLAGMVGWAALTVATAALAQLPVATLLPLLLLAVTFELVFSLHMGVERIGRYIQVVFEGEEADSGWEHYAMAYGRSFRGSGSDPLFSIYFWIATVFNFVPALSAGPVPLEWGTVGALHLLFAVRIAIARRQAAHQRAVDLERFEALKASPTRPISARGRP